MDNFRISVPKPCHEDWDKMTPEQTGKFCGSCAKTVVDFTQMLPEKMQQYFIQHQNEKVCGRFKATQLNTINITIPESVLYRRRPLRKALLLAIFVVMGNTLFSCRNDVGTLGEVSVVKDTVKTEITRTTGIIRMVTVEPSNDTVASEKKKKCVVKPQIPIITGDVAVEPAPPVMQEEKMGKALIRTDTIQK
jgi:hypothetical protein